MLARILGRQMGWVIFGLGGENEEGKAWAALPRLTGKVFSVFPLG